MEESKDLQTLYKVFRTFIYVSLIVEFFEYAINPNVLDHWGGILVDIHDRIKLMDVYQDGHLLHSKVMTLLIICITCIGTRNKKHLEFNAKTMVIYPISIGIVLMFLSVWVFYLHWTPRFFTLYSSTWLYFFMSVVGTVLCHIALDNISKYLKDGLLKDRFNFENESFEQMEEKVHNDYSVNIPMRYYYKGLITSPQVAENQFAFRKVSLKETNEKQIPQKLLFYRFSIAKVRILFLLNECFGNNVASVYCQTPENFAYGMFLLHFANSEIAIKPII